jgi:hypothetical protein
MFEYSYRSYQQQLLQKHVVVELLKIDLMTIRSFVGMESVFESKLIYRITRIDPLPLSKEIIIIPKKPITGELFLLYIKHSSCVLQIVVTYKISFEIGYIVVDQCI